jgi:Tol biopolymer transport system component
MGHIFISYSHKDKGYAHKLRETLLQEGFEVWIDDRIEYGEEWPLVIQEHLDTCDAFILVATENSFRSRWVQKEVTRAERIGKRIFPLLLSGQTWLSIESTQYVDVSDGSLPTERFYKRLESAASRNKLKDSLDARLETLKNQATRYESMGELSSALNVWSEIQRLDSHYPGVDRKIDELEKELRRTKENAARKAKSKPVKLERRGIDALLENLSQKIDALRSISLGRWSFLKITGLMSVVILLVAGAAWLLAALNASPQVSHTYYPFVFSVETGDEVSVCSYDIYSNGLSILDLGAGRNWDPTYSSLGNLYFTSDRDGGKAEIYRLVDGVPMQVTETDGSYESWGPALSPNGALYFTSDQKDGKAEIYRLVNGQSEPVTDTQGNYESWGPVVSPTGTVYFTSNRNDGRREVYRLINGQPEPVTDTEGDYESWGPAIGPSGIVYFTSNRGDGYAEIYRLVENGEPQAVTNTLGSFQSWGPVITSEGTIYYTSTKENGKRKVFMLVNSVSKSLPEIPGRAEGFTDFVAAIHPVY